MIGMGPKAVYCAIVPVIVICSFVSISNATRWSYCGSKKRYSVLVTSVIVKPDPVVRGQPATFNTSSIARNIITGGKLNIEVFFYGLSVYAKSHDLCSKTSCPVQQGNFLLTNTESLPESTPLGFYRLRLKLLGPDTTLLTCIYISFRLVRSNLIAEN